MDVKVFENLEDAFQWLGLDPPIIPIPLQVLEA
jgi:hypothetical protein